MLPRNVGCETCGEAAIVRAYGHVEYEPREQAAEVLLAQSVTTPETRSVRLTIDCPRCGIKSQDYKMPAE